MGAAVGALAGAAVGFAVGSRVGRGSSGGAAAFVVGTLRWGLQSVHDPAQWWAQESVPQWVHQWVQQSRSRRGSPLVQPWGQQ